MSKRVIFSLALLWSVSAATAFASPTVSILKPAQNARYSAPADITLWASASDPDAAITQVEYFNHGVSVGVATAPPYEVGLYGIPAAHYSFTAVATNANGVTATSKAVNVIANSPPTVSLTAPLAGTSYVGLASIPLAASAQDSGGTIKKVDFLHNGVLIGTATAEPFALTWTGAPVGKHTLVAKAQDNDGATTASDPVVVTVTSPITIAMTSPAPNAKFAQGADIFLEAAASDSVAEIQKVEFYSSGQLLGTAAKAPFNMTWSAVPSGSYRVTAVATDSQGIATTSAALGMTVNAAPTVVLTAPTNGASATAPASITLAADASDPDGQIQKLELLADGKVIATLSAPPYQYVWSDAAPGVHTLSARATDDKGARTVSAGASFTVINPLTVSLTAPLANARYVWPAPITLSANVTDSAATVSKVDFYNGTTLLGSVQAPPYTFIWANAATGKYAITARATDSLGLTATSAKVAVTVNVPPTVTLSSPANGNAFVAPASIPLLADATDADGIIARVDFYNGSTLLGSAAAPPYGFNWENVGAGNYSLSARAVDNTGGVTKSAALPVRVVASTPYLIASPAAGAKINSGTNVLIATNIDGLAATTSRVDFLVNNVVQASRTQAPFAATWAATTAGSYALSLRVTDVDGVVTATAPVKVTVVASSGLSATLTVATVSAAPPAQYVLSATLAGSAGVTKKMAYYSGASLLGVSSISPFTFAWNNVAPGTYAVSAIGTDSLGATATTDVVTVTVGQPEAHVFYIHTDQIDTPRVVSDENKKMVWQWSGDRFGADMASTVPSGAGAAFVFNLRFPGQYFDAETGLHYNYFRDYDPQSGRYVQSDPIGLAGGINTYSYVKGSPVNSYDPQGLDCVASGGTVNCNVPGGPKIDFPRPAGWPDYMGPGSFGYHFYNEWTNTAGQSKKCLEDYVRTHPTPGQPQPAAANGTFNDATPDYLSWYPGSSPVYSYSREVNGQQVVVNVTQPGHPLFPGYVARMIVGGANNSNMMNNFGEGTAFKQSEYNPLNSLINNVWQRANDAAIKACTCSR